MLARTEIEGLSAHFAAEAQISKRFTAAVSSRESLIRELEMRLAHVATGVTALLSIAGCAPPNDPRADAIAAIKGEAAAGELLYRRDCVQCHGDTGAKLAHGLAWYGLAGAISIVIGGVRYTKMPAYPHYSDREIADLFAYIGSFRK